MSEAGVGKPMNILVIKQTSLGDVLHASGHIRAIKLQYPNSHLVLLTATTSAEIYQHNPWVDELILVDRVGVKKNWWRKPIWAFKEMRSALRNTRRHTFDLAIDLQGLAKSVSFLYAVKADQKFVKGRWWKLNGFRNKALHAIKEMDKVLSLAGISADDTSMELVAGDEAKQTIDDLLLKINPGGKRLLIISPYSRWFSKDWPLDNYISVSDAVSDSYQVVFSGLAEHVMDIDHALKNADCRDLVSVAGKLSLLEFAELVSRATLMLTGDSFPMHVSVAKKTPVIALFGPTDEAKVGPLGERDQVIRVPGCDVCDRKNCPRYCLSRLRPDHVTRAIREFDI